MFLKYKVSPDNFKRRKIDVKSYNYEDNNDYKKIKIICETNTPHDLHIGDKIIFKYGNSEFVEKNDLTTNSFEVLSTDFSKTSLSFLYNKFKSLNIKNISNRNGYDLVMLNTKLPNSFKEKDTFNVYKLTYKYEYHKMADDTFKDVYETTTLPNIVYYGDYVKYFNNIYKWVESRETLECKYYTDYIFECGSEKITKNDKLEIDNIKISDLKNNSILLEYNGNFTITLPITSENNTELLDENISQTYFNEKKKELINDIVDYEKVCFSPVYYQTYKTYTSSSNVTITDIDNDTYKSHGIIYEREPINAIVKDSNINKEVSFFNKPQYVNSIRFNLFFRDRNKETWNSSDNMGWFQCKINNNGFDIPNKLLNGDLLGNLNFTNDDVYYRKQRLGKSFLRLSFYDSNNPMKQMLLFYSTIFVDTAELYDKYCKNIGKKGFENNDIVNSDEYNEDNLTMSFLLNDKYTLNKSSDGFYLYLFPDGIDNDEGKTMYMKVDFNHAGNGKTIPFIYPNKNGNVLDFSDKEFPFSLIDENNGSLNEYYRQLYIPITIKYDKNLDNYIYYFNILNESKSDIVINLFEPKMNPYGSN